MNYRDLPNHVLSTLHSTNDNTLKQGTQHFEQLTDNKSGANEELTKLTVSEPLVNE